VPVFMFGSWVLNEIWIIDLSSALVDMLISSSKFFFSSEAHLNSDVRLLLELCCVIVIKHVAFFTICAKLTMAFTFTSLPLKFYTVSGKEPKYPVSNKHSSLLLALQKLSK